MRFLLVVFVFLYPCLSVFSQEEPKDTIGELFSISFSELLSLKVESATKHEEDVFDSPLAATIISGEEIIRSGVTSVAEALRLCAGTIVRQQNKSYFNMHLRGFDDVLPIGNQLTLGTNAMTLVMIDGRPVFNYFQGGTFWETLPIGLNDIEKIEVIRGPSSALYGQNAVAGVINIFTKKGDNNDLKVSSTLQTSPYGDMTIGANIHQKINDQFDIGFSSNMNRFERGMTEYFGYRQKDYVHRDSLRFLGVGGDVRYPDEELALNNHAINTFLQADINENIHSRLSVGVQESEGQRIYADNLTSPFSTNTSKSGYVDVKTDAYSFHNQLSYQKGSQNTVGMLGWEYDYDVVDATLEYEKEIKGFRLRPGIAYHSAIYNDQKAVEEHGADRAFLGQQRIIDSKSAFLHSEYKKNGWRAIVALRYDLYNTPEKGYGTYQFILAKKINEKHLLRGVMSRANKGSFMLDSYYNQRFEQFIPSMGINFVTRLEGNQNLDLLVMDMFELGYRFKGSDKICLSMSLNHQRTKNYASLVQQETGDPFNVYYRFENLPLDAVQNGGELEVMFTPNKKLFVKGFVSMQSTKWRNEDGFVDIETGDTITDYISHFTTPKMYGGFEVNYNISKKWNVNVTNYFMSSQTINSSIRSDENDEYYTVASVFVFNTKVTYALTDNMKLFVNGRNLLANNQVQTVWGDKLNALLLFGLDFKL